MVVDRKCSRCGKLFSPKSVPIWWGGCSVECEWLLDICWNLRNNHDVIDTPSKQDLVGELERHNQ